MFLFLAYVCCFYLLGKPLFFSVCLRYLTVIAIWSYDHNVVITPDMNVATASVSTSLRGSATDSVGFKLMLLLVTSVSDSIE